MWFITAWFGAAITCLIFSILFAFYLSKEKIIKPVSQNFKLYAALPQSGIQVFENIDYADGRAIIIENFFKEYKSPLANRAFVFVSVADKYSLDWKLLPAIAMQESNGGVKIINNSYNPFGYGIYGSLVVKFTSWEESIERVGKAIREDYLNKGLTSPVQIMAKYTPPSAAKGGLWARSVSTFMEELR